MQIKTTRCHVIPQNKSKTKISGNEDVEKLELLCFAGGNVKWYSCYRKLESGSLKKKIKEFF